MGGKARQTTYEREPEAEAEPEEAAVDAEDDAVEEAGGPAMLKDGVWSKMSLEFLNTTSIGYFAGHAVMINSRRANSAEGICAEYRTIELTAGHMERTKWTTHPSGITPSWKEAKSAEGWRLLAMLNVSWNSSVLTSWRANTESEAVFVQVMLTSELLAQSTGIWRSRPWAKGARARAATKLRDRQTERQQRRHHRRRAMLT